MHWLEALDTAAFRFCNSTMQNPCFDWLMPLLSGYGVPWLAIAIAAAAFFIYRGSAKLRLLTALMLLTVALGDPLIIGTLKRAVARPRPFVTQPEARHYLPDTREFKVGAGYVAPLPDGSTPTNDNRRSFPSAHSANWFALATLAFIYYRRRAWFLFPLAAAVAFSRVYNGVHFPSDILAGAIIGAGYAAAFAWLLDQLWQTAGKKFFPLWQQQFPSLLNFEARISNSESSGSTAMADSQFAIRDSQFLRLGYALIFLALAGRLAYLAAGVIELSEDESYYWLWSKHPALSYYSKPPLVALTIWLGTHLFGDTAFGVRFFSPVIAAVLGIIVFRFMARAVNARAAFVLLFAIGAAPLLAVGATLMTIDPLSVLFWTAAMLAGWRAVQENSTTRDWLWVGLWMGLGFLSKYTALFQLLCWTTFFALAPAARKQLRRPGPWLALAVNALAALPVLIWNAQHDWITVRHVADDAHAGDRWKFTLHEFLANEFALLNPVFFLLAVWAALEFWRRPAGGAPSIARHDDVGAPSGRAMLGAPIDAAERSRPLCVYLFAMGAPLFLVYALWSCRSRVMPNWIAPSILPLFCLAVIYWQPRWREIRRWVIGGMVFGFIVVALLHQPAWIQQLTGRPLPREISRTVGWRETAAIVSEARLKFYGRLPRVKGQRVFLIGGHYGTASQLAFNLDSYAYCVTATVPKNQFYFWPGYADRPRERYGDNALYVQILGSATPLPAPAQLLKEFGSVTDAGVFPVDYHGKTIRWVQITECRGLR